MGLGIGIGISPTLMTGVGALTPEQQVTALFGSTAGFFFDPADRSSHAQQSDGSTPVAADGDAVGWRADKSPNGFNQMQATAAARPLWKTDGLLSWLLYQGTDDYLANAAARLPLTDFTYFDVIEETTSVANAGVLTIKPAAGNDYDQTTGLHVGTGSAGSNYAIAGSTGISFSFSATGAKPTSRAVREIVKQGGATSLYVNGALASTDSSYTAFDALSAGGFMCGSRYQGGLGGPYLIGREFFRYFIGRTLSPAERTLVRTLAAARGGITL